MQLEDWIREHQAGVWRYLRLLGADGNDADDLVQETFLRFLRAQRPEPGDDRLLRTIARGLWIDRHRWLQRRRARERAERIDELIATGGDDPRLEGWLHALATCREQLAPRARQGLDLFYGERMSRSAIAARLGLSPHGVRNLLARTRQALKKCIERRHSRENER